MIEIVPNLHPITVHYPIALLSITTLLFLIAVVLRPSFSKELLITSKWCLWIAGISAIIAASFGWQAYNSVAHDAPSHAAMTVHRMWAVPTAIFIFLVALFCYVIRDQWGKEKIAITVILLLCASGLTSVTGYLGAEAVYRYGIGVVRIPETDSHSHSGGVESTHDNMEPYNTEQSVDYHKSKLNEHEDTDENHNH
jgi:uncharacterized membrane protein